MSEVDKLHERIDLLHQYFREGKIQIAEHLSVDLKKSLEAIRYDEDGKIVAETVDARVRSLGLAVSQMHRIELEKKAVPLKEVQEAYFEFVRRNFEPVIAAAKEAAEEGCSASHFAQAISENEDAVSSLLGQIPEFMSVLSELWESAGEITHHHIQEKTTLKGIFGGDLFPSVEKNIASTCGLYLDTIVLSDPFIQSRHIFEKYSDKDKAFYLIKHAINLSRYHNLALADTAEPIVVVTPFRSSFDEGEQRVILEQAKNDAAKHASFLFGENFQAFDEVEEFCERLEQPEMVVEMLRNPDRLLFDCEWKEGKAEQIKRAMPDFEFLTGRHAGRLVAMHCLSRMGQATDILRKSQYLQGTPLVEAETSWKFFDWKLQYNSDADLKNGESLHLSRGLQHVAGTEYQWLGRIPPEALIEMRKQGALPEIREMLSRGVSEIAAARPDAFFRTSDKIVDNIRDAFENHKANINELKRKKLKFAGLDVGSWLVTGTIEVAAAVTSNPALAIAGIAANQLMDAPKLKEIPKKYNALRKESADLKKSPMGLFFSHRE